MASVFAENAPKYGAWCKSCSLKHFSTNVGKIKQHLMHHLLYIGTFAHCLNWSVKLTPAYIGSLGATYKQFFPLSLNRTVVHITINK
jgi:hypothetical protein